MRNKNEVKILPVLRYPCSKRGKAYNGKPNGWKIDKILQILNVKENSRFLDLFSGSGIVGVNVKHLTNAKVDINDYDDVLPIQANFALENLCSFQGMNKYFTKAANEYAIRRIANGYWDKVDKYNKVFKKCFITKHDFQDLLDVYDRNYCNVHTHMYADHPYHEIKGLYKNSFSDDQHILLKQKLTEYLQHSPSCKILISYNDTPFIRDLYKDWYIQKEEFQYQTGKLNRSGQKKKVNELFITNFKW